jgi:catechol 2,3-dioxygenase-like lactoylglutathione lyase family enzyme
LFRVAVAASDLPASRRFYEHLLAIEADDTVPSRLYFHCGATIFVVVDWTVEGRGGTVQPNLEHAYFATDDVDAAHERAAAAGAGDLTPVREQPWGERSFYCADPDGHPLCFVDDGTLFLGRGAPWA